MLSSSSVGGICQTSHVAEEAIVERKGATAVSTTANKNTLNSTIQKFNALAVTETSYSHPSNSLSSMGLRAFDGQKAARKEVLNNRPARASLNGNVPTIPSPPERPSIFSGCRRFVSVSSLSTLALLVAVLVCFTTTSAIITLQCEASAREIAETATRIVSEGCSQRLATTVNLVTDAADLIQFAVAWDDHAPMPSDDNATHCSHSLVPQSSNVATRDADAVNPDLLDVPSVNDGGGGGDGGGMGTELMRRGMKGSSSSSAQQSLLDDANQAGDTVVFEDAATQEDAPISTRMVRSASSLSLLPPPSTLSPEAVALSHGEGWHLKWHKVALMHGRGNTFGLLDHLTITFHDGSYAGCVVDWTNASQVQCHHSKGDPTEKENIFVCDNTSNVTQTTTLSPAHTYYYTRAYEWWHNVTYYRAGSGMLTGNTSIERASIDPRGRRWYRRMIAKYFGLDPNGTFSCNGTLYNSKGYNNKAFTRGDGGGVNGNDPLPPEVLDYHRQMYMHGPAYAKQWGAFTTSPVTNRPSVTLSFTLVNRTGKCIGLAAFNIGVTAFSRFILSFKPSPGSHVVLLGDGMAPLATSVNTMAFRKYTIHKEQRISEADFQRGCVVTDISLADRNTRDVYCQMTIEEMGYQPLIELATGEYAHLLGGVSNSSAAGAGGVDATTTRRLHLAGEAMWVSIATISSALAPDIRWKVVMFLPEKDITLDVDRASTIAILVSAAIGIVVICLFVVLLRILMKPLADIARKMESGDYLDWDGNDDDQRRAKKDRRRSDDSSSESSSSQPNTPRIANGEHHRHHNYHPTFPQEHVSAPAGATAPGHEVSVEEGGKGESFKRSNKHSGGPTKLPSFAMNNNNCENATGGSLSAISPKNSLKEKKKSDRRGSERVLSLLVDVASIQKAYWDMSDELRALKGYIPQHICEEVVKYRRCGSHQSISSHQRSPREPSVTVFPGTSGGGGANATWNRRFASSTADRPTNTLDEKKPHNSFRRVNSNSYALVDPSPNAANNNNENTREDACRAAGEVGLIPVICGAEEGTTNSPHGALTPHHDTVPVVHAVSFVGSEFENGAAPPREKEDGGDGMDFVAVCVDSGGAAPPTASGDETSSLRAVTEEIVKRSRYDGYSRDQPIPVYFRDNALVDRDISVALVNIVGFHQFAQTAHGADVTKHHEAIVSYLSAAATRCGGVLDTFSGDKFWVSFNATSKCDGSAVAAGCFGLEVATCVNREAAHAREALMREHRRKDRNEVIEKRYRPRFKAALRGLTVGLSTGRAFVGPLGTSTIRRHSIISNAMSEASALERQCSRYPDCAVMVGGDMIPAIEGYFQYLLIDACVLPGSGGMRRRIASLKGTMCAPSADPTLLQMFLDPATFAASCEVTANPYAVTNDFFNAFLEGRNDECIKLMGLVDADVMASNALDELEHLTASLAAAQSHEMGQYSMSGPVNLEAGGGAVVSGGDVGGGHSGDGNGDAAFATAGPPQEHEQDASQRPQLSTEAPEANVLQQSARSHHPTPTHHATPSPMSASVNAMPTTLVPYTAVQRTHIVVMLRFVWSLLASHQPIDGRMYRSPFSAFFIPNPCNE